MDVDSAQSAVLLVHGAWHLPEHYARLGKAITDAGFLVIIPRLPSMNGDKPPTKGLVDDIAAIKKEASDLVEKGHPLLVLCHSYGGIVGTNALSSDLSIIQRQKTGRKGGIVHVVYMCAFMPQIGDTIAKVIANSGALLKFDIDQEGNSIPQNPVEAFYGDLPKNDAREWAKKLLTHPISAHTTETENTAWKYFPITYLYCELDHAITFQRQEDMVKAAVDSGAQLRAENYKASHSPYLSIPTDMAKAVKRAWNSTNPETT
ncbi:MAG: hypothetical protein M1821_008378 [Bathelium mastoideum]|nr:MAG: hypothetical protein M1821_008378 [Bathelium mastoideum]